MTLPPLEMWDDYSYIPYSRRIDTDVPHSLTAPLLWGTHGRPGWLVIRNAQTRVTAIVKGRQQNLHLIARPPPDTVVEALAGRPISGIVDHPLFAPGTLGGDAVIKSVSLKTGCVRDKRKGPDFLWEPPSMELECGSPLIDLRNPPFPVVVYRAGRPLFDAANGDALQWHQFASTRERWRD